MPERQASYTAFGTAYVRAAHQLLEAPPHILEDPIAVKILGPATEARIREQAERYQEPAQRALRAHVVLRSRFAEDQLAAAMQRGITQYIILGAGLDTFALRQPEWARGLRIFEVDHAASQATKRAALDAAGLALPDNTMLVTIDFEHESLQTCFQRYPIALNEPTFFSWLGVTMYLQEDAIDAVLRTVAAFPPGSEIVLTFARPRGTMPSPFDQRSAELGEPWVSFFGPDQLEAKLHGVGFSTVEFLSPAVAEEKYFRPRPQDLPVLRHTNIVSAIR